MATGDVVTQAVDPVLQTVDTAVAHQLVTPGVFAEIGMGIAFLVVIISVHGWCMGSISKYFGWRWKHVTHKTATWKVRMLVGVTISMLALTHFFETLLWTGPLVLIGAIPNFRDAYYFVLEAYTTLGEGSVGLPDAWRLLGPVIAISGLFTFSWTGSVLVYVMTENGRRQAHPAPAPKRDSKDHPAE